MIEKLAPTPDAMLPGDLPSPAGAAPAEGAVDFSALLGLAGAAGEEVPAAAPGAGEAAAKLSPPAAPGAAAAAPEQAAAGQPTETVKPLTAPQPELSALDLMSRIAAWLVPEAAAEQKPSEPPAEAEAEAEADTPEAPLPLGAPAQAQPMPMLVPAALAEAPSARSDAPLPDRRASAAAGAMVAVPDRSAESAAPQATAQPVSAEAPLAAFALPDRPNDKPDASAGSDAGVQPLPAGFVAGAPVPVVGTAPGAAASAPAGSVALEDLLVADAADGAWLDRLASDIRTLADGAHREAHLKLNPRMLGDMDIRLDLDGRHARVHFTVETAAAQALITDGASRLSGLVEANGLKLDGATVDLGQGRRDERQTPAERAEPDRTLPRAPRPAAPELLRAAARTRIVAGYERYA